MTGAAMAAYAEVVAALVRERLGLGVACAGVDVAAALRRVMTPAERRDPMLHLQRLRREAAAFDALIAELTVGETYFFREPEQLDFVRRAILPELASRRPAGVLRAWSAGCATGEEAYSLAILLHEAGLGARARVLGTDVARARLAAARRGRYRPWSLRGVPAETVRAYFTPIGGEYQLAAPIRAMAEFSYLNLAGDDDLASRSGFQGFDLVLCRNVLIYLDPTAVARMAGRLVDALAPGGVLLLGASDPPLAGLVPCEVVVTGAGVAYRRRSARPATIASAPTPRRDPAPGLPAGPRRPPVGPPVFAAPAILSAAPWVSAGPAIPPAAPSIPPVRPEPPAAPRARPTPAPAAAARAAARPAAARPTAAVLVAAPPAAAEADGAAAVAHIRELADAGRLEEAGRAAVAALERFGASAELLALQCMLLVEAGQPAAAVAAARRALYLDRRLVAAHLGLGAAFTRMGAVDAARGALRSALRLLAEQAPMAVVPGTGGATAGAVAGLVRLQLELLGEVAA